MLPRNHVEGRSAAMRAFYRRLGTVAATDLPVLLLGETGVGKEGLARALHLSSLRARGPFVVLHCAAIPLHLLEAELFGIGPGVATGVRARAGKVRRADGGTLFLDEIGDMPPELQVKLLRVLQEGEVEPLGGGRVAVNLRVVSATHVPLDERLDDGGFRHDLYYRLAGDVLRVPPLRERREDLPALVEHFLRGAVSELGKTIPGVTVGALEHLAARPWPGNVRQLAHEVRRLAALCPEGEPISSDLLTPRTARGAVSAPADTVEAPDRRESLNLEVMEREMVREALRRSAGRREEAARLLGISRTALYRKMIRLDLQET